MSQRTLDDAAQNSATPLIPRWIVVLVVFLCLAAIANVYWGRVINGPADLYRKDQCKTMAYTVDMVLNHRFSLPRDVIFQPATKPPLYNWFAAIGIVITRHYGEWVQKWPSIASALAIAGLLFAFCRRSFARALDSQHAFLLACFAAAIWISSKSTILLLYIARPDMLQALCLIGAWLAANEALAVESKRAARKWAAWFWLATTAAALAKGPAAVYPILYALLAAPLVFGNWRKLSHFYWLIGLPVLLGSVGLWLACAAAQDWPHVRDVLLGSEVAKRIVESRVEGGRKPVTYALLWWRTQNTYWSYLAIGSMAIGLLGTLRRFLARSQSGAPAALRALETIGIRATDGLFTGPDGMATLWTIVVVGCLSIPADKRQDFLLPSHPAAAVLAASFLIRLITRFEWTRVALPLGAALLLLWERKFITPTHLALVAGAYLLIVAGVRLLQKQRPLILVPISMSLTALFLAFEVSSNTHWGFFKTSPAITFIGLFAGAAIVASVWVATFPRLRLELPIIAAGTIFWGFQLLQNNYKTTGQPGSTNPSLYATRFANEAKKIVGDDKVVCIIRSKHPILTLMGRHQGSYLTRKDFEDAEWVIVERSKFPALMDTPQEVLYSGKVDVEFGHITQLGHLIMKDRVSLIRIDKEKNVPSVDQLVAIHLWVQDWTTDDANPYRSANTGWIDTPGVPRPAPWKPPNRDDPWFDRNAATQPGDDNSGDDQ